MSRKNNENHSSSGKDTPPLALPASSKRAGVVSIVCLLVAIVTTILAKRYSTNTPSVGTNTAVSPAVAATAGPPAATQIQPAQPSTNQPAEQATMLINQAVMVTVELDFGGRVPTIAEALRDIERRYGPDDGKGRTFAILDAYGGPTADGKKLHMSMHVSSEKPGNAALAFRRTGEVLWQSRIVQGTNTATFTGKDLSIWLDNGAGKAFIVDGSGNPASLLDARLKDNGQPVRDFWPEGAEREVTYLYSACGCPVKVMARRMGERTARTKELPVIFPDDPAVVQVISRLMDW